MFLADIRKIMYTPVNHSFPILKWGLRGSKLYRRVFVMYRKDSKHTKTSNKYSTGATSAMLPASLLFLSRKRCSKETGSGKWVYCTFSLFRSFSFFLDFFFCFCFFFFFRFLPGKHVPWKTCCCCLM